MSTAAEQPSLQNSISAPTDTLEQERGEEQPRASHGDLEPSPGDHSLVARTTGECATSLSRECWQAEHTLLPKHSLQGHWEPSLQASRMWKLSFITSGFHLVGFNKAELFQCLTLLLQD